MEKVYTNPRSLFEQRVNDILTRETKSSAFFEDIFKLQQIYTFEKAKVTQKSDDEAWKLLMHLFTILGSVEFAKLISVCGGKTITFPTEEDYKDSIITSLCYYYREIDNMDWDEIKEKIDINKLNTIKYGIRVQQLKSFIDGQIFRDIKKMSEK
jgi:hypothetical protein